jgi:hypothetical protein
MTRILGDVMAPFLRTIIVVSSFSLISSSLISSASLANDKPAPHAAPAKPMVRAAAPHPMTNMKGGQPGSRAGRPGAQHAALAVHNFHGHRFHGRAAWDHGHWHHEARNGRMGWWYDVDGAAYYYDQPQYPYPADISDVEYIEPEVVEQAPPPPPPTVGDLIGGFVGGVINQGLSAGQQ